MLRSLACGWRDFKESPDTLALRYNWIFLCLFEGELYPSFDPAVGRPSAKQKANFWVIPPQTRYVVVAATRHCERAVFHFSHVPEILEKASRAEGYLARKLRTRRLDEVRSLVASIEQYFANPTALTELRSEIVLLKLTLIALDHLDSVPVQPLHNLSRGRVERALAWYTEHMAESPTLREVAAAVHVSPSQLRRHFYERLGRSPKASFNRARMQRATKLLVNSDQTLDQIAHHCGFNTASDFCRAFKNDFHVTPNSWRRNVNSASAVAPK